MSPIFIPVILAGFGFVSWLAYLFLGGYIVRKTGSADGLSNLGSAAEGFWKWRRRWWRSKDRGEE